MKIALARIGKRLISNVRDLNSASDAIRVDPASEYLIFGMQMLSMALNRWLDLISAALCLASAKHLLTSEEKVFLQEGFLFINAVFCNSHVAGVVLVFLL